MTRKQFRIILVLSITTAFLSAGVDIAFPQWTDPFNNVLKQQALDEITNATDTDFMLAKLIALSLVGACFAIAGIIVIVGLFKFRPWAPRLNLVFTSLAVVSMAFMDPVVQSGLASAVYEISTLMWGATLVIPYLSPVSGYFANDTHGLPL
jgi:hypothetical protein